MISKYKLIKKTASKLSSALLFVAYVVFIPMKVNLLFIFDDLNSVTEIDPELITSVAD